MSGSLAEPEAPAAVRAIGRRTDRVRSSKEISKKCRRKTTTGPIDDRTIG